MSGEQNQIHLIYVSEATVVFEREDLHKLLAKARKNNNALGITGVLLYVDGFFLQVLEGNEGTVLKVYEKIKRRSAKACLEVNCGTQLKGGTFADWSVGYADVGRADLARIPGLNDFFARGTYLDKLDAGRATGLVRAFREGRWRRRIGA